MASPHVRDGFGLHQQHLLLDFRGGVEVGISIFGQLLWSEVLLLEIFHSWWLFIYIKINIKSAEVANNRLQLGTDLVAQVLNHLDLALAFLLLD